MAAPTIIHFLRHGLVKGGSDATVYLHEMLARRVGGAGGILHTDHRPTGVQYSRRALPFPWEVDPPACPGEVDMTKE